MARTSWNDRPRMDPAPFLRVKGAGFRARPGRIGQDGPHGCPHAGAAHESLPPTTERLPRGGNNTARVFRPCVSPPSRIRNSASSWMTCTELPAQYCRLQGAPRMRKNGETRGFIAVFQYLPPAVSGNSPVLSASCAKPAISWGNAQVQGRIVSTTGHKVVMPPGSAMCAQNRAMIQTAARSGCTADPGSHHPVESFQREESP